MQAVELASQPVCFTFERCLSCLVRFPETRRSRQTTVQCLVWWCSEEPAQPGAGNWRSAESARAGPASSTSGAQAALNAESELPGAAGTAGSSANFPPQQPPTAASRLFSFVGNTVLASFLASAAFLGYYQVRYDSSELEQLVEQERQQPQSVPRQVLSV